MRKLPVAYHIHKTLAPTLGKLVTADRQHFLRNRAELGQDLRVTRDLESC